MENKVFIKLDECGDYLAELKAGNKAQATFIPIGDPEALVLNKAGFEQVALKLSTPATGLTLDPASVPTLAPAASIEQFAKGDESPYYKLQRIEIPIVANEMTYQKSFFEALLKNLAERPVPGSKTGHNMNYGARSQTDFLLIGGVLVDNGRAIVLKNYIPAKAESDNGNFIRECKADLVHFSLVAYAKKEISQNDDGSITINITDCSPRGLRNDAVSYGEGAMNQLTNTTGRF